MKSIELTVAELKKQSKNPIHLKAVEGLADHAKVTVFEEQMAGDEDTGEE